MPKSRARGEDEQSWLVKEVERRLQRFGRSIPGPAHEAEAAYEVEGHLRRWGFPGYFLVTADLVKYAKD